MLFGKVASCLAFQFTWNETNSKLREKFTRNRKKFFGLNFNALLDRNCCFPLLRSLKVCNLSSDISCASRRSTPRKKSGQRIARENVNNNQLCTKCSEQIFWARRADSAFASRGAWLRLFLSERRQKPKIKYSAKKLRKKNTWKVWMKKIWQKKRSKNVKTLLSYEAN